MSPGSVTGMSPAYNNEPSPDYSMLVHPRLHSRPISKSPNTHPIPLQHGRKNFLIYTLLQQTYSFQILQQTIHHKH